MISKTTQRNNKKVVGYDFSMHNFIKYDTKRQRKTKNTVLNRFGGALTSLIVACHLLQFIIRIYRCKMANNIQFSVKRYSNRLHSRESAHKISRSSIVLAGFVGTEPFSFCFCLLLLLLFFVIHAFGLFQIYSH